MASKSQVKAQDTAAPPVRAEYLVLARKYRPRSFADLKGQDALVRTLTNAISTGRIAHAFMLTGVRGVGKTTTARIIARALNCIGADGKGMATAEPCGQCVNCKAIAEDRHIDVIEMDAASKNGVEDIRALIDSVQYAPSSARYKIFIIDEVHMLSKPAFNALLKTLEEPPEHVKFIFATTEIRKVPITVLSRCQRFDLRRIEAGVLEALFSDITTKEGASAEPEAIALIARAADGSARDGLSLLDQALARSDKNVTESLVRDMLGLADRAVTLDLFETIHKGETEKSLEILASLHKSGGDPVVILQDLLELTHFLTKIRAAPDTLKDVALPEAERTRGKALAATLSMPTLGRSWQILLKGLHEVQHSPLPQQTLEMVAIRLLYAADLPNTAELVKQARETTPKTGFKNPTPGGTNAGVGIKKAAFGTGGDATVAVAQAQAQPGLAPSPANFLELATLFQQKREAMLYAHLYNYSHLIKMEPGQLVLRLTPQASKLLPAQVGEKLSQWTGQRWVVALAQSGGAPTLADQDKAVRDAEMATVRAHPVVAEILKQFPGAAITEIKTRDEESEPAGFEGEG